jgi:hypothetical protein
MCDSEQTLMPCLRTVFVGRPEISPAGRNELMLRTMDDLEDYSIAATDGSVGRVKDFFFDDELWIVRYFVVETGAWTASRKILISTMSIRAPNWLNRLLPVSMTRRQALEGALQQQGAHPLRSCKTVTSAHIRAPDGDIGHVCGFLIDEENWEIRYLIVDTCNWWLGHQVLIAPEWIEGMSWDEHTVSVKLTRAAVRDAPPYRPKTQFDRDAEMRLHDHYGYPGYWANKIESHNTELQQPYGRC